MLTETNQAFKSIATSSAKVAGLVGEIAAASGEQSQGIEQINQAVLEMDKAVQGNAANAEESASASEEIRAQTSRMAMMADELDSLVEGAASAAKHQKGQIP